MKKESFYLAFFLLGLTACKKANSQPVSSPSSISGKQDKIVYDTLTGNNGNHLILAFNNTQNTLQAKFNNEIIEMKLDTVASGIAASNKHYQYIENKEEILLKKDGKPVFVHTTKSESFSNPILLQGIDGKSLQVVFNNKKDIASFEINGKTVELQSQKPASGIWYKNDKYELRGKGSEVTLSENGKAIFETKK